MPEKTLHSAAQSLLVFLGFFLVSVTLQWTSGAWRSDFGAHADEGAHVVTSLMVRDYIAGGWREQKNPRRYAEEYYEQFPKVAIGHYPPGFYVAAAIPLLFSRSAEALLVFMALLSASTGWATWRLGSRICDLEVSSLLSGLLVCLLPLVRTYTAIVMADLLLVTLVILAVISLGKYFESGKARDSLAFGLLASLAILTKGSGLFLAVVPVFVIASLRRWKEFCNFRLWLAPVPVVLLAFPWLWFTKEITEEGMQNVSAVSYAGEALVFYARTLFCETGFVPAILGAFALFEFGKFVKNRNWENGMWMALLISVPVASLFLMMLVPTGIDARYVLPALPFLLLLSAWICERCARKRNRRVQLLTIVCLFFATILLSARTVEKRYTGASEIVGLLPATEGGETEIKVVVVSNARGEGAITAAAAFQRKKDLFISRGSKLLSESDWRGRGYTVAFSNSEELSHLLANAAIDFAILEQPPENHEVLKHWQLAWNFFHEENGSNSPLQLVGQKASERKRGERGAFYLFRLGRE